MIGSFVTSSTVVDRRIPNPSRSDRLRPEPVRPLGRTARSGQPRIRVLLRRRGDPARRAATRRPTPDAASLATAKVTESMARVDERDSRTRIAAVLVDAAPPVASRGRRVRHRLANFTWADIYDSARLGPKAAGRSAEIRSAYRHTDSLFQARPDLAERSGANGRVGILVTPGIDRRAGVACEAWAATPTDRLVYFYIGRYGQENMGWRRLERLDGVHFVGFHPAQNSWRTCARRPPTSGPIVRPAASADAIVAKAGGWADLPGDGRRDPLIYPAPDRLRRAPRIGKALRAGVAASASRRSSSSAAARTAPRTSLRPQALPPPFPVTRASMVAGTWKRSGWSRWSVAGGQWGRQRNSGHGVFSSGYPD